MPEVLEKLPDSQDAEEWISPEIFIYHGDLYEVQPDGTVKKLTTTDKVRRALSLGR